MRAPGGPSPRTCSHDTEGSHPVDKEYRLARLVTRLGRSEAYRAYIGGLAYVDIRLLDAAVATAEAILAEKRKHRPIDFEPTSC